jgi:CRP/FNR family transcriptional regulator, cyclic AMP receptor protein
VVITFQIQIPRERIGQCAAGLICVIRFAADGGRRHSEGRPLSLLWSDSRARRRADGIALLQSHPVFGALTPAQLEQLVSMARPRRIASGATLFAKGDPGTELFAVVSGTVKIIVPSSDGREAIITLFHRGEIFGEIALLDGQPRTADAVAMTACDLMVIERRNFLDVVYSEPKIATKLTALLCARLRIADARIEETAFLNLPTRLARLLVQLLEGNAAASDSKKLTITQQKISEMLGASRESVNRHLQAWAKREVIALKRGAIVVLAPQALAAFVSGDDDGDGKDSGLPGAKREPRSAAAKCKK